MPPKNVERCQFSLYLKVNPKIFRGTVVSLPILHMSIVDMYHHVFEYSEEIQILCGTCEWYSNSPNQSKFFL